jgi:hypothetical protein
MLRKTKSKNNTIRRDRNRNTRKNGGGSDEVNINKCKPGLKGFIGNTCFTKDIVEQIKYHYNINATRKITVKKPNKILEHIKNDTKCNDEQCWMKVLPKHLQDNIVNYLYRPIYPKKWNKNKNEWLSNFDMLAVIEQYEEVYTQFKFIGPTFIDFDTKLYNYKCVENDLCNFNINTYLKNKQTKIGIIFNLDKHYENGSHWVSLFVDLEHNFIFYFNSTGEETPPEIDALINRIIKQSNEKGIKMDYKFNALEHQLEDTECGMYSLFFIISMLTDSIGGDETQPLLELKDKIRFFTKTRIPDKDMEKLRDKYYVK